MAVLRIVYGLLGLAFLGLSGCQPAADAPLTDKELANFDFKIEVGLIEQDTSKLSIKESFTMPREQIMLKLPNVFLRTEKLYDRISDLRVSGSAKLRENERDPSLIIIEQEPGARVELSYLFAPFDEKNYPTRQENFSAPIIRNNYFQFVGLMALAYPLPLMESKPFPLELEWDVPEGFQVVNSFGGGGTVQKVTTDFDKLRDGLFIGGAGLRSYNLNVRNRPVYLTIEGKFTQISDQEFIDVITRLLTTQRETWQDDNFPYFFINILSNNQPCSGNIKFAGTAHTNSFRAFFPSDCPFLPEMKQLISHELMHMWIGKKIKVGQERGNIDGKWFTEGWTDFFGRLLAFKAGVLTEKEYFDSLNRQLEKYSLSTEKDKPLKELVERMYKRNQSNRDLEDVPYQQGEIMALNLNKRIKVPSNFRHSLADVVREMLKQAKEAGGVKHFSTYEIEAIVDRFDLDAKDSFMPDYSKVENGQVLYPPKLEQCRTAENHRSKFARMWSNPVYTYGQEQGPCSRWLL